MKQVLLATVASWSLLAVPAYATLNCTVLIDGSSIGNCLPSNNGALVLPSTVTSPLFSQISLTGSGFPALPQPDLSTVTLDVTAASTFSGMHNLEIEVFQSGLSTPAGSTIATTFTSNELIGNPGPTTESDFVNGSASALGTMLRTVTFPAAVATGNAGPFFDPVASAITADAHEFLITFTAPQQSSNDTIQLQGITPSVPEPSSLALLGGSLTMLGLLGIRRRHR